MENDFGKRSLDGPAPVTNSAITAHPLRFCLTLLAEECLKSNQSLPPSVDLSELPVAMGRACGQAQGTLNYAKRVSLMGIGISRQHCSLVQGPDNSLQIVDESSQGVAVNGVRIPPQTPRTLKVGDVVVLGLPMAHDHPVGALSSSGSGSMSKGGAVFRVDCLPGDRARDSPAVRESDALNAEETSPSSISATSTWTDTPAVCTMSSADAASAHQGGACNKPGRQGDGAASLDVANESEHLERGERSQVEAESTAKEAGGEHEGVAQESDRNSDVEIVEVRSAATVPPRGARKRRRPVQVVSLLDDDDEDEAETIIGALDAGAGRGWQESQMTRSAGVCRAAACAEEKEYKRRWLKALECPVCMEPLCAAAHMSCGHIACFTCIHRRFALQSVEDGSAYGFQDRKRLCPVCRKAVFFMSRDVKMDELVDESMSNHADRMTTAERAVWERRKRDGLALSQFYERKIHNNPQNLVHRRREIGVKVSIKTVTASGSRRGDMSTLCSECRQAIGGPSGRYIAVWKLTPTQGFRPVPCVASVHLECLKSSTCKAIRAGLSPDGILSLLYRLDVLGLLADEENGIEGFRKKVFQALSEERQEYPWWVDGAVRLQICGQDIRG